MASAIIIDNTKSGQQQITSFDLKGLSIAFSISNAENIADFSFNQNDLDKVFLRLARLILSIGGNIVYGGDLRPNGFTEQLKELARSYTESGADPNSRFIHLKVWHPSDADHETQNEKNPYKWVKVIDIGKPENPEWGNHPTTLFAESLSKMRMVAALKYDATIIMGGQHKGYKGYIPGIVEEFIAAVKNQKPIYLVGCFGGVAQTLFQYFNLNQEDKLALLLPYDPLIIQDLSPDKQQLIHDKIIKLRYWFEEKRKQYRENPFELLNNGLSLNDNKILATTRNPQLMCDLILKGLYHVKQKH